MAFAYCNRLSELKLSSSLTKIEDDAFSDVTSRATITFYGSRDKWESVEKPSDMAFLNNANMVYDTSTVIDIDPDPQPQNNDYPTNVRAITNSQYHQIQFIWDKVQGADKYGIAVYLAGKWRVQTSNITNNSYVTPKNLTPGMTYKVAIAEQMADPATVKGIVPREVIRIVTPGTVISSNMLSEKDNNYLMAIYIDDAADIAWCDLSTGEFCATNASGEQQLEQITEVLVRVQPKEIITNVDETKAPGLFEFAKRSEDIYISCVSGRLKYDKSAPGMLLSYLKDTQKQDITHLEPLRIVDNKVSMRLDKATIKNLELTETLFEHNVNGSLLGVLDLCGTTQSISRIEALTKSASDWTPAASGVITSAAPAKLTFNWGNTYTNSAIFTGAVSLEQAGAGTVYLTAASASTGDLIATAGRISLWPSAKWIGRIVLNGGTVAVPGPGAFGSETALVAGTGALELPAGEYSFVSVTDAEGNPVAPGRYAATASAGVQAAEWLAGEGVVEVLPSGGAEATYVWTGAGDGLFSSAANWEGGVLPDFSNAGGRYVFPGNGFTATVDAPVFAKEFAFPSGVADTARLASAGEGQVTFVDGSLVVTAQTTVAKSVVFDVPVRWSHALRVRVGEPDVLATRVISLVFTNRLSTVGEAVFSKDGCGVVRVFGDANDIQGDILATNGFFYVTGADPLGGSGAFRYYQRPGMSDYSAVVLNNAVVTRDVVCNQTEDRRSLTTVANTTNVVLGQASNVGGHFRISPASNSQITFAGGMTPGNFLIMQPETGGSCIISNTPVVSEKSYWTDAENATVNVLACPGNSFTGGETWHVSNTLELRVDNAIRSDNTVKFCMWGNKVPLYGKLDLTDTAQELARSFRTVTTNADGTVKYLSPGQVSGLSGSSLKLSGSQTVQILPVFTGAASFIHAGTATRRLRNACTSTGELHVVSGTLVMEAPGAAYNGVAQPTSIMEGGTWAGPKVTLAGGTVQVNHAKAFDRHASLYVPYGSTGVVNLPAGVRQPMEYLYLEDENGQWQRQKTGRWGAVGGSAPNKSAIFSGAGMMNFIGDGLGTMLIFR